MGKKSPSPPPAPDPVATAQAQGAANKDAAYASVSASEVNQYAPWGSTTWTGRDPSRENIATGQTITLAPDVQRYYNTGLDIANKASSAASILAGNIPTSPIDTSGLPSWQYQLNTGGLPQATAPDLTTRIDTSNLPNLNTDFSADSKAAQDAVFKSGKALLDPVFSQQNEQLEQKLADQGLTTGGDAYNKAWTNQTNNQDQQWENLANQAVLAGNNRQAQLFGMTNQEFNTLFSANQQQAGFGNQADLSQFGADEQARQNAIQELLQQFQLSDQARQQALQEEYQKRNQAFNETALALGQGGQLQTPTFQATPGANIGPAPIASSTYNSAGINNQNYWSTFAANQQNQQNTMSSIASVAAIAAMFI